MCIALVLGHIKQIKIVKIIHNIINDSKIIQHSEK